jgi:hypothetical protein
MRQMAEKRWRDDAHRSVRPSNSQKRPKEQNREATHNTEGFLRRAVVRFGFLKPRPFVVEEHEGFGVQTEEGTEEGADETDCARGRGGMSLWREEGERKEGKDKPRPPKTGIPSLITYATRVQVTTQPTLSEKRRRLVAAG